MKELSIEEKAKRYDEAKERMKDFLKEWEDCGAIGEAMEKARNVFPELKESEGLRIIKAIKYGLDHVFTNNTTVFEVTKEQCLAWLEKQGEQKPKKCMYSNDNYTDEERKVLCDGCKEECELRQKSAWSEEDNKMLKKSITLLNEFGGDRNARAYTLQEMDCRNCADWLNSFRPQNKWKPSDGQIEALWNVYRGGKEQAELATLYNDLKKLREE